MHVLLMKNIVDTSCPGEAERFNRMAATEEGAARKNKETAVSAISYYIEFIYSLLPRFWRKPHRKAYQGSLKSHPRM